MKKIIILILLCIGCSAHAASPITIVRGQDFPPYHYMDIRGREAGFIIEILTQVSQNMDMDITFAQYPWSRCLRMVKTGDADAMMNLFKTEERTAYMYFPETALAREVNRFFTLKSNPVLYPGNLEGLKGLRLGAIRNYSYGRFFDRFSPKLNILRLETEKALILNLISQRCDLILGNEIVLESLANQIQGGKDIIPTGPDISDDPLYIGFSKARGHKELAEKFSKALKEFKAGQTYKSILKKYSL